MKNKKTSPIKQHVITTLMVLSIALIAYLSYKDMLGYFFTMAAGTIREIETSRIQSFNDIFKILTEPILSVLPWYRPIAKLSYSLDYSIWELNPFGYHLTDLILHILVSIFVFFLMRLLINGKQFIAWLAAIIFTTHPILFGTVPANDHRADLTSTLFIILSLLLFVKYHSMIIHKRVYLVSSIFFSVLALGGKEIAVILPILIFTYLIIFSSTDKKFFKDRMIEAVKQGLPYFLVTFIFLVWRSYILKFIGKYPNPMGFFEIFSYLLDVNIKFLVYLLYPVDFLHLKSLFSPLNSLFSPLNSLFSPFPTTFKKIGFLVALFSLLGFLLFYKQAIFKIINHNAVGVIKTIKILLAMVVIISIICILVYPLISPYLNQLIQQSYNGEGPQFLMNAMESRDMNTAEIYFYKARNLILRSSLISLFLSSIYLIIIHQRGRIKEYFINSAHRKLISFLLFWLILQFGLYIVGFSITSHFMYMPAIAFSSILSIMIVEGFQSTIKKIREYRSAGYSHRSSLISSTRVSFVIIVGLFISLLAYSSLIRTYKGWGYTANIAQMFLHKVSEIIPELPNDAIIHIYNLPSQVLTQEVLQFEETTICLDRPTVKSWINLNYPNNHMNVIIHSNNNFVVYPNKPVEIQFEAKKIEDNEAVVYGIF